MEKKPKSEKPVDSQEKKDELDNQNSQDQQIREMGQVLLSENQEDIRVELLTIIGEVEGHESAPSHSKTTKYEHVLPKLAMIEDDQSIEGLLILLNTVGGDVEAGLAIAEMIASLSKPTVSLVLGGGHSIGVPMAVSADYSFVVPSATMVIHPVRSSGMFIGVAQTYRNMEKIQDRITGFISRHSGISKERLEELMLDTSQLVKDVGTMLEGREAVKEGLINPDSIIIDAKSGTSGAGRGAKVANLFCEVNESMKAYGVGTHRHTPEIEEQLGYACNRNDLKLIFTPHLVPMNRGILVTAYANLTKDVTYEEVKAVYDKYYKNEYFVRVLDKDVCPETRWVEGSNFVDIGFKIEPRTNRLIMMGALDNLVKGAAGQAVQNMNIMFGLPENEGLQMVPLFP